MGKRGPKKAPATVKLARGTFRQDRDGDPAAAPRVGKVAACPPAPDELEEIGRSVWLDMLPRIITAGYFAELDLRAFERYCRAHDEVEKCDVLLEEHGEYFTAETGYVGQHPAVNQRFKWLDIIRRYEEAFWLNPTARSGKQVSTNKPASVAVRKRG